MIKNFSCLGGKKGKIFLNLFVREKKRKEKTGREKEKRGRKREREKRERKRDKKNK